MKYDNVASYYFTFANQTQKNNDSEGLNHGGHSEDI